MSVDAITNLAEIRAQLVAKLRASMQPAQTPATGAAAEDSTTAKNPTLEELRSQLLEKARSSLNLSPSSMAAGKGYEIDIDDMRARMLFYRIKNANISREQRDSLSSTVRAMAADKKIDGKTAKSISEMIFMMEMSSKYNRKNEFRTLRGEKTVDEEMKDVYSLRSEREAMREKMDSLQRTVSKK